MWKDPLSHLLRRRPLGGPFTLILTYGMTGGFWKTRDNPLPETNIAMENPPFWWYLQVKMGFSWAMLVSGRVGTSACWSCWWWLVGWFNHPRVPSRNVHPGDHGRAHGRFSQPMSESKFSGRSLIRQGPDWKWRNMMMLSGWCLVMSKWAKDGNLPY